MKWARVAGLVLVALLTACRPVPPESQQTASETAVPVNNAQPSPPLVAAARGQIGVTLVYDPAYVEIPYPGGDVPVERGVCTDVTVRALRNLGVDLQRTIHEDMRAHFREYPQKWGLPGPNPHIDHRRVPNQMRWFEREGWSRDITTKVNDYAAGDIAAWRLNDTGLLHIGIVSDRKTPSGTPLVIHNIGSGAVEDDILFRHTVIGHYRPVLPASPLRRPQIQ
ncbi:MAG: DUF1287 domain-containing protein [Pseudoxanthomonas sp.]